MGGIRADGYGCRFCLTTCLEHHGGLEGNGAILTSIACIVGDCMHLEQQLLGGRLGPGGVGYLHMKGFGLEVKD
jgi:hypothetical protein